MKGRIVRWMLASAGMAVLLLVLGVGAEFARQWTHFARQDCRAAVLMLHRVVPDHYPPTRYSMRETEFVRQLEGLATSGVRILSEAELLTSLGPRSDAADDACPWGGVAVLLTFDMDGASHHVQLALPHLARMGVPAMFFVPTGFLDRGWAVTSEDIATLSAAGMAIGSHSHWHRNLITVPDGPLVATFVSSRDTLSALSERPVRSIAAPGGRYDQRVLRAAGEAGFDAFFNSDPCYVTPDTVPMRICRIEVRGDRARGMVHWVRSPRAVARQATSWGVKRAVEKLVGDRAWQWLSKVRSSLS